MKKAICRKTDSLFFMDRINKLFWINRLLGMFLHMNRSRYICPHRFRNVHLLQRLLLLDTLQHKLHS